MSTPEPQGIGAVVSDKDGDLWVRGLWGGDWEGTSGGIGIWPLLEDAHGPLTVLTHGVHPDGTPA